MVSSSLFDATSASFPTSFSRKQLQRHKDVILEKARSGANYFILKQIVKNKKEEVEETDWPVSKDRISKSVVCLLLSWKTHEKWQRTTFFSTNKPNNNAISCKTDIFSTHIQLNSTQRGFFFVLLFPEEEGNKNNAFTTFTSTTISSMATVPYILLLRQQLLFSPKYIYIYTHTLSLSLILPSTCKSAVKVNVL